ncbi:MAG: radical SAM family heme chaperone HemW [Defluviitaleaceae bacterium]|nr:radical SAM family heme chaperone HemW [Defluviitaleaceae bacterium]
MTPLSLYIHIPFCRQKCIYCDFLSVCNKDHLIQPYVDALCADISASAPDCADYEVVSIFFGGGTPTMLEAKQLSRIFALLADKFCLAKDVSVTTEANPETIDASYLSQLCNAGFNRISFGVQSFDDRLLAAIGRVHSAQRAVDAVNMASAAGFDDINVDLIYALPYQSLDNFATTLDVATSLPIAHISCYALTVEEDTPLAQNPSLLAAMPDDIMDRQMYHMAREMLTQRGFEHYELSNWAKVGYACRHNVGYWTHRQYAAFGVGAHGFINNRRVCKTSNIAKYIDRDFSCRVIEKIDEVTEMAEFMMLGLRMIKGIDSTEFAVRFRRNIFDVYGAQIQKFTKQGLIYIDGAKIALTAQGLDLANTVFAEFL